MMYLTMGEIHFAMGMSYTHQKELANKNNISFVTGKGDSGLVVYGYTRAAAIKLIKSAGYVLVLHEGKKLLVVKRYLKGLPGRSVVEDWR